MLGKFPLAVRKLGDVLSFKKGRSMSPTPSDKSLSPLARGSRLLYVFIARLFTLGVVVQVFLAGLGVLVNPSYFVWHENFSHVIGFFPLVMLLVGLVAGLRWQTLVLTALLSVLFVLQYIFLYLMPQLGLMPLRALHTVNALSLFWLSVHLGSRVWRQLRMAQHNSAVFKLANPSSLGRAGNVVIKSSLIVFFVVLFATNVYGVLFNGDRPSEGSSTTQQPQELNEVTTGVSLETGKTIFNNNCAVCHGKTGEGIVGPALAGNEKLADTAHVVKQILNGGGPMPAWKNTLSDEEIASVASFIRASWGNAFGDVSTSDVDAEH
jgi:cytochrome c553